MSCSLVFGDEALEENFGAIGNSASVSLHGSFPAGMSERGRCLKFYLLESKYDVRDSSE